MVRLLTLSCPRCLKASTLATKVRWRMGRLTKCPTCGAAWSLDRRLIWACTSTVAAVAGAFAYFSE